MNAIAANIDAYTAPYTDTDIVDYIDADIAADPIIALNHRKRGIIKRSYFLLGVAPLCYIHHSRISTPHLR